MIANCADVGLVAEKLNSNQLALNIFEDCEVSNFAVYLTELNGLNVLMRAILVC